VAAAPATSTPPRKSVTFSQVADIILPETQQPPAPVPVVFADFRSNLPAKAIGDSAANLRAAAGAALDSDGAAAAAANKSDAFKQSLDAQFNARLDSDDDQGDADPALQSLLKF
jgi:hypothetical protein